MVLATFMAFHEWQFFHTSSDAFMFLKFAVRKEAQRWLGMQWNKE